MENPNPNSASNATTKRIFRTNSNKNSRSISMSDTESQVSFYSPYPFDSPLNPDDPVFKPDSNSMTIVPVSKKKKGSSQNLSYPATPPVPPPPPMMFGWTMNEGIEHVGVEDEVVQSGGERRSRSATAVYTLRRPLERIVTAKKVALGFRICEVILCLISFCVMGSDKTRGWSGDSFYRYREYRYLVGINIIGFLHSGFQVCDITYCLVSGNHVISHYIRYYSDFMIDQILAYLLMSASSAAATRLVDWISNWGKDAFTSMATTSIWTSFLAFFAFAFSSLICGYIIGCSRDSVSSDLI